MTLLFVFLLGLNPAWSASSCSEMALARVESARLLLQDVPTTAEIDRSSIAERALILLDRTLKAEPDCGEAKSLRREAQKLVKKTLPISEAADLEAAILQATERVSDQERANPRDPEEIETLGFMIADLEDRFPQETRLPALARRVDALRGE